MTMNIVVEIRRADLPVLTHNRIMRNLNRQNMERHVAKRLPKHFKMVAYSEYGARRRSANWEKRKAKLYHTKNLPNVASGNLLGSLRTKITSTPDGAKLKISAKSGSKIPEQEWSSMSPLQQSRWIRANQRRLASWQKQEIAVMSKKEITEERHRLAVDYRIEAMSPKNRRKRKRRIKSNG